MATKKTTITDHSKKITSAAIQRALMDAGVPSDLAAREAENTVRCLDSVPLACQRRPEPEYLAIAACKNESNSISAMIRNIFVHTPTLDYTGDDLPFTYMGLHKPDDRIKRICKDAKLNNSELNELIETFQFACTYVLQPYKKRTVSVLRASLFENMNEYTDNVPPDVTCINTLVAPLRLSLEDLLLDFFWKTIKEYFPNWMQDPELKKTMCKYKDLEL